MAESIDRRMCELLSRVESLTRGTAAGSPRPRVEGLDDRELARLARERAESVELRCAAIGAFVERNRTEKAAADLLLELLDDPEEAVATEVMRRALPFDARMVERLRALMDDPREAYWTEATLALARRKDRAILPALMAWFRGDDGPRRRAAIGALDWVLFPAEKPAVFAAAWESGRGDEADRLELAVRLLVLGDERVVEFLDELAERGEPGPSGRARAALRAWAGTEPGEA